MYYGHIPANCVILTGVRKKGRGYEAIYDAKNWGKVGLTISVTECLKMIKSIPAYQITYSFYTQIKPLFEMGNGLAIEVASDLKKGKCTYCKSQY